MYENINALIQSYLPIALLTLGLLAFVVSAVTQVIKNIGFLAKVPTDIVVLILAVGIAVASLMAYSSYLKIIVPWYYILAAIIAGFLAAFVAMFGWTKLYALYKRFKISDSEDTDSGSSGTE